MSKDKKPVRAIEELLNSLFEAALSSRGQGDLLETLRRRPAASKPEDDEGNSHSSCSNCKMRKYMQSKMRLVHILASADTDGILRYDLIVNDGLIVYVDEATHDVNVIVEDCENVVPLNSILNKDDGGLPVFLPGVAQHAEAGAGHLEFGGSAGVHCYATAAGMMYSMLPDIVRMLGRKRMFKGLFNAVATVNDDGSVHIARPTVLVH